ncbi:hypothetical protein ACJQWK_04946 [Exserohilum turcicum]
MTRAFASRLACMTPLRPLPTADNAPIFTEHPTVSHDGEGIARPPCSLLAARCSLLSAAPRSLAPILVAEFCSLSDRLLTLHAYTHSRALHAAPSPRREALSEHNSSTAD